MEKYIENTLQSVIFQKYPNLEYIVIDGDSKDDTLRVIRKYEDNIEILISEKDEGMYHAIDKGIRLASGDVIAWLNADDQYFPWTLQTVNKVFSQFPDTKWVCGIPSFIDENGTLTNIYTKASSKPVRYIENGMFRNGIFGFLQQESMFWRRDLYFTVGGLDLNYKYAGDFELWTRFAKYSELVTVNLPLAAFRKRKDSISKSKWELYDYEVQKVIQAKKKLPNIIWYLAKKDIFVHLLKVFTFRRSKLVFYIIKEKRFVLKNCLRSLSSNSISELILQVIRK